MEKAEIGLLVLFGVFALGFGVAYLAVAQPLKRRLSRALEAAGVSVRLSQRGRTGKSYRHGTEGMMTDLRLVKFLRLYTEILTAGSQLVSAYCARILAGNPPTFEELLTPIRDSAGKAVSFDNRLLGFELWRIQRPFFQFLQEVPAACWADERKFEQLAREYLEREKERRVRSGWVFGGT